MKIENSNITMTSTSLLVKKDEMSEEFRFWIDDREPQAEEFATKPIFKDRVTITDVAKSRLSKKEDGDVGKIKDEIDPMTGDKIYILKVLVEALTGKKIKIIDVSELQKEPDTTIEGVQSQDKPPADKEPQREGWGLVYNRHESLY